MSDFSEWFLKGFFNEQFLDSYFTETFIFKPIRLIYFHWKGKTFNFLLINLKIFNWKISEYFLINWRDLNKLFYLRIWMSLLNSKTLNLFFETLYVILQFFFLLNILILLTFIILFILLIWLWILLIFKLKWLIWILWVLLRFSILLWHYYILCMNG